MGRSMSWWVRLSSVERLWSGALGRKRVLIIGLLGSALTSFLFGVSKSYAWALLMRGLAGSLSGNHPILLNIVGDITDETNEVAAIGLVAGINNVAEVTGPFIG